MKNSTSSEPRIRLTGLLLCFFSTTVLAQAPVELTSVNADLEPARWTTPPEPVTDNGTTGPITVNTSPGTPF